MLDDIAALGAPEGVVRKLAAKRDGFPVRAENRPVVEAFLIVQTQWRTAGMGQIIGLDYTAVTAALNAHGVPVEDVFSGLQVMEHAALEALSKR